MHKAFLPLFALLLAAGLFLAVPSAHAAGGPPPVHPTGANGSSRPAPEHESPGETAETFRTGLEQLEVFLHRRSHAVKKLG